ncbi:Phosphoinositide 3-kinase regulatory subunit [Operophtera brumata]|uniref:Phosphoinositide 3-kinase regulatory subunit n=1 Tax=Operophtera brumata TaxID=104452 RepID=A0A0L7LBZ4_OPEBR|nr:Phosphoinositide 3-kinase regulatory subunit [Operophtera brumata]
MYNRNAGPVVSLAACEGGQSLVAATQEGSIFVLRSAGPVVSLAACEGGQSLVAATQEGSIFVLR